MHVRKIHVLYEHGPDLRPYGSSYLRLIRPFSHPMIQTQFRASCDWQYSGEAVDAVVIDRLWNPDQIRLSDVEKLIDQVRSAGARLIFALDDNFLDMPFNKGGYHEGHRTIVNFLVAQADGLMVTTPALYERMIGAHKNVIVIPNHLDERLLNKRRKATFFNRPISIGYMGTPTHRSDLRVVSRPLEKVFQRHPDQLMLQVIGGFPQDDRLIDLERIPFQRLVPPRGVQEYPLFMNWFTGTVNWDIAIAPLEENQFNQTKSDVKFLDYASIGAAGIYSDVPAYSNSVHHGDTGLLVSSDTQAWEDSLERLIVDQAYREKIADLASSYLYEERIIARRAKEWVKNFNELVDYK